MLCDECQTLLDTPVSLTDGFPLRYWSASHRLCTTLGKLKELATTCYICHTRTNEVSRNFGDIPDECECNVSTDLIIYDRKENDDASLSTRIEVPRHHGFAHALIGLFKTSSQGYDSLHYPSIVFLTVYSARDSCPAESVLHCISRVNGLRSIMLD